MADVQNAEEKMENLDLDLFFPYFGRTGTQSMVDCPCSAQTCETSILEKYISQTALWSSQRSEPAMPRMLATAPELLCSSLAEASPTPPRHAPPSPGSGLKAHDASCAYQRQALRARGRRFAAC